MNIAVIGGGAAGYFAAISVHKHHPKANVTIFEKSNKVLSKVRISGGGRCNVTHACYSNRLLSQHYPRGERFLRKAFEQFSVTDTIDWFHQNGVELKTEPDGRMFPVSDSSESVIHALSEAVKRLNGKVILQSQIEHLQHKAGQWVLMNREGQSMRFDKVIIASGGSPAMKGLDWLKAIGEEVISPVPSLFTFNINAPELLALQGVSMPDVQVKISGSKRVSNGAVLITHWGLSGPAILKLSAFAARHIADAEYRFNILINWLGDTNEDAIRQVLLADETKRNTKRVENHIPFPIPQRLWGYLVNRANQAMDKRWIDISQKERNRLVNTLSNDVYHVKGKTTFKEEFVTAGGVDLKGVNPSTMESQRNKGLYFAGEILNIDGVTGGFNFQAAWTTGWIAGQLK